MLDKNPSIKALESFVLEWNIENPVDRWWRSKHGIAFNSSLHREISFIDEYMEFYEDSLYNKAVALNKKRKEDPYIPNSHNFFYPLSQTEQMSEEEFDNIEI